MALAAIVALINFHFHMSSPFWQTNIVYISRQPKELVSYGNIILPFPPLIWAILALTLLCLALFLFLAHHTLGSKDLTYLSLVQTESSRLNIFLFTFVKVTEPGLSSYTLLTLQGQR